MRESREPRKTREHRKAMLAAVACALSISGTLNASASSTLSTGEEAHVLILNTADTYLPGHVVIENAMRESLDRDVTEHVAHVAHVAYFFEYLDAYRFPIEALEPEFLALLGKKYSAMRIDVVVAVSRPAIEFFERHGERLWPHARVVYNAFSADYVGPVTIPPDVTAVVSYQDVDETLALALRLRPNPQRVVVIAGATDMERSASQLTQTALSKIDKLVPVELLSGLPLQELIARVAALPPEAIIIYLTQYRDREGRPYTPREVLRAISAVSAAPVFGIYETYLGFGVAAGHMESYEDEGRLLAEQVLAALSGGPPAPNRVILKTPIKCIADARALRRWALDQRRLPEGCEVHFAERSLWHQYGWVIAVALAIISGETVLILGLIAQRRRRRLAESESRKRLSEIAHINRRVSMGELSASIAHELKQPLTSIQLNASAAEMMLGAKPPNLEEVASILSDIKDDNRRANDIIDRIRDMVRPTKLEMRSLDLNEAIQQCIKVLASEASARGVRVEVELEPGLPNVHADGVQLQQVILNLALNAMDAMHDQPPDRRSLSIRSRRANHRDAEVSVTDSGVGIAQDSIESIFEPFVTTKSNGMGMGLSISRTIIEAHDGQIRAENSPVGGAVFYFTLPLAL